MINKTNNCYANWDSGRLIISYIYEHNEWPSSWDSLEPLFRKIIIKGPLDFNQIKSRVNIEFKVNLNKSDINKIIFVSSKDGKDNYFERANPNKMIKDYISTKDKHGYVARMNLYPMPEEE
jgi:hypothetical protein